MLTILPPNEETIERLNQPDARFLAGEMVQVRVTRKGFLPEYIPLGTAQWRQHPVSPLVTRETLRQHDDWACFFAFLEDRFVGQLAAAPEEFGLCKLLDIRVDSSHRRQGVGTGLLNACVDWALKKGRKGVAAEVSDENPVACQFFQSQGFTLGGVDKLRHFADPRQAEKPAALRDSVLTFYRFFDGVKR